MNRIDGIEEALATATVTAKGTETEIETDGDIEIALETAESIETGHDRQIEVTKGTETAIGTGTETETQLEADVSTTAEIGRHNSNSAITTGRHHDVGATTKETTEVRFLFLSRTSILTCSLGKPHHRSATSTRSRSRSPPHRETLPTRTKPDKKTSLHMSFNMHNSAAGSQPPASPNGNNTSTQRRSRSRSRSPMEEDNDDEGEVDVELEVDDDAAAMQAMMGFGGFGTTKGKKIPGNNTGAVQKEKKTEYRQYMNRQGGFNRPLSPGR